MQFALNLKKNIGIDRTRCSCREWSSRVCVEKREKLTAAAVCVSIISFFGWGIGVWHVHTDSISCGVSIGSVHQQERLVLRPIPSRGRCVSACGIQMRGLEVLDDYYCSDVVIVVEHLHRQSLAPLKIFYPNHFL